MRPGNRRWIDARVRVLAQIVSCVVWVGCGDDSPGTPQGQTTAGIAGSATAGTPGAAGTAGAGAAGTSATGTAGRAAAGRGAIPMAGSTAGSAADDDAGVAPVDAGATQPDAGASPDAGGMQPDAGGTQEPPPRMDLGEGDGSDVITIGDSWMSLGTTGIQQSLVEVSGQRYRTYGRGGTRLLNEVIPRQYTTAKMADPDIKTVIMTGGGNDIIQVAGLREDCAMMGERCSMVVGDILDRLTALWTEMAMDGVQDVVYVQYSNPEGNNVDFALPDGDGLKKRCEEVMAPLRCHRLETLDIVMGDIPDGIHPSAAGYDRIGKAVYDLMIAEGMRR